MKVQMVTLAKRVVAATLFCQLALLVITPLANAVLDGCPGTLTRNCPADCEKGDFISATNCCYTLQDGSGCCQYS